MGDMITIIWMIGCFIAIVMLFAQAQLFSIAREIKRIRELLEEKAEKE